MQGGGDGSSRAVARGGCNMPQAYAQCRAAREVELKKGVVEISAVSNFGCEAGEYLKTTGSFMDHSEDVGDCFMGARVQRGGRLANQNLCASFDPANLRCVSCKSEHDIIGSDKPVCICLADQSFVSKITGGVEGSCIPVVRIEGGGLEELSDMFLEIFDGYKFPPGSIVLLGSATHLLYKYKYK